MGVYVANTVCLTLEFRARRSFLRSLPSAQVPREDAEAFRRPHLLESVRQNTIAALAVAAIAWAVQGGGGRRALPTAPAKE
jgi:hypothetical protein